MERHTFAFKINRGRLADYRKILGENWAEIKSILDDYKKRHDAILPPPEEEYKHQMGDQHARNHGLGY